MDSPLLRSVRSKIREVNESSELRSSAPVKSSSLRSLAEAARKTFSDEDIQRLRGINPST